MPDNVRQSSSPHSALVKWLFNMNIQSHSLSFILLIIVCLMIVPYQINCQQPSSTQIVLQFPGQPPVIALYDNMVPVIFTKTEWKFSCSNQYRYTYNQSYTDYNINAPYYIIISNVTNDNNNSVSVTVQSVHKKIQPTQNASSCISGQLNCVIQVRNNCKTQREFDAIQVQIQNMPAIYFNVICNSQLTFSPFQAGQIILVIFSVFQIIVCSKFQQANSYHNAGHYINYISLGIYCIIMLAGQVIILIEIPQSTNVASYLCMAVAMLCGILGTMVVVSQLLFCVDVKMFRIGLFSEKIPIRIMDISGFLAGIGIVCAWYFTGYNWIISDIIYMIIFLAVIKLIKFDSLRIAAITFLCTALCNITFILMTQFIRHVYFNNVILYIFNNPLFLFCPCINFTPNQNCSWFFISCIAYPGILLCYLDRVDCSRASKIYSLVFVITFTACSIVWLIVSNFVPFTLPFDLINSPISIAILCFFANRRGEFSLLWYGQIYDDKHKHKKQQQNELQSSLKQQRTDSYKSQWFRIKYSNLSNSSAVSAARKLQLQKQILQLPWNSSHDPMEHEMKELSNKNIINGSSGQGIKRQNSVNENLIVSDSQSKNQQGSANAQ